jgi:hypothetical protein
MAKERTLDELREELEARQLAYEETQRLVKEKELEEAKIKEEKLAAEKDARMEEINVVVEHLEELCKAYLKDYGSIELKSKFTDYDYFPIFWKNHFWF